jgi:hypothetical protein
MQRSGVSGRPMPPLVYYIIHSLPIESWVVDDEAISERGRVPRGLHKSGSKLGPLRKGRSMVRIVTGDTPRIHQPEQERPGPSLLFAGIPEVFS